jgi:hypothetical protein
MFLSQIEPHTVLYTTHTGMQAFLLQATVSPTLCAFLEGVPCPARPWPFVCSLNPLAVHWVNRHHSLAAIRSSLK